MKPRASLKLLKNHGVWTHKELNEFAAYYLFIAIRELPNTIQMLSAVVLIGSVTKPSYVSVFVTLVFGYYMIDKWAVAITSYESMGHHISKNAKEKMYVEGNANIIAGRGVLYVTLHILVFAVVALKLSRELMVTLR